MIHESEIEKGQNHSGPALAKESIIDKTQGSENLPRPSFLKRGDSSLWKREVRRDFTTNSLIFP